jgi:hypothetical protein
MDIIIDGIIRNKALLKNQKLSAILKYLFVDKAKISQDKYYILGSFGLREHRSINDLDINLDYDEFLKLIPLIEKGIGEKQTEDYPDETYSLKYLKEHGGLYRDSNGHQYFNLTTLLRWKQQMGREKDRPDIELI